MAPQLRLNSEPSDSAVTIDSFQPLIQGVVNSLAIVYLQPELNHLRDALKGIVSNYSTAATRAQAKADSPSFYVVDHCNLVMSLAVALDQLVRETIATIESLSMGCDDEAEKLFQQIIIVPLRVHLPILRALFAYANSAVTIIDMCESPAYRNAVASYSATHQQGEQP